jgi:hypothetical protein
VKEHIIAVGRVVVAVLVVVERLGANRRVADAVEVVHEHAVTKERVAVGQIAAFLTGRSCLRQKRKTGEHEWDEETASQGRAAD